VTPCCRLPESRVAAFSIINTTDANATVLAELPLERHTWVGAGKAARGYNIGGLWEVDLLVGTTCHILPCVQSPVYLVFRACFPPSYRVQSPFYLACGARFTSNPCWLQWTRSNSTLLPHCELAKPDHVWTKRHSRSSHMAVAASLTRRMWHHHTVVAVQPLSHVARDVITRVQHESEGFMCSVLQKASLCI
jgi:hypothetical protein